MHVSSSSWMRFARQRPASELGDLVRNASNHKGPWPKVSVWHGNSDRTVNPVNAGHIVSQWLDVHGLSSRPMSEDEVDGYPHQVWWNSEGQNIVESFTITGMAHGTPLGLAENDERYGLEGAFLLEAGISSSYHIAKFFGLTRSVHKSKALMASSDLRPCVPPDLPTPPFLVKARPGLNIGDTINNALKAAGLMR